MFSPDFANLKSWWTGISTSARAGISVFYLEIFNRYSTPGVYFALFQMTPAFVNMVLDLSVKHGKPAIVIVPGSFSPTSFFTDVIDALRTHGFEALVETLQSSARSPQRQETAATMEEDAAQFMP